MDNIMLRFWLLLGVLVKTGGYFLITKNVRTMNFEAFGVLTSILNFDSVTMVHVPTLP